jgi:hypothetical protein
MLTTAGSVIGVHLRCGILSASTDALDTDLLQARIVSSLTSFVPLTSSCLSLRQLPTALQANLIQRFHLPFPDCLFLVGCLGELHHGIHTAALARTSDDLLLGLGKRRVRWQRDD